MREQNRVNRRETDRQADGQTDSEQDETNITSPYLRLRGYNNVQWL